MTEREQLEQAIAALEAQRAILGDAVVDASVAALREKLAALKPPPSAEQQRKQVTVLFADISGFTAMSETMDVEEVSEMMNALWTRLDQAITEYGGRIDKHMGDAVMALWGAETAREDDPERAIHAALAMQAELVAFREDQQADRSAERSWRSMAMRTGINTGPVLLGEVGTTGEYTAMGDTVNTANRLEQAAPVGSILISHDTYRHVRGVFDVHPLEPIQVKGKAEPLQVYVVQRAKPRAFRTTTRGIEGIETHMIGREAELKHLQDTLYTTVEGSQRQMVTITGEAGVGKSRLLYEFENWADLLPERIRFFKGRASLEMQNLPYALIRGLFSFRFQIQDSDRPSVVQEKMEQGIAGALGENEQSQMQAHFMGQLLGFDFADSPHLQGVLGDAKQLRDRALIYLTGFFKATTARLPTVILLEDIHWADDSSLDVLNHLALATPNQRLLLVCSARPTLFERRPHWGVGQTFHTRLELHPLSKQDSRCLVEEILQKVEEVPVALRELVVSGAEGNPFYVEELIKMLIEDKVVIKGEDRWRVEPIRLAKMHVPPTLTGILQARLDSLPLKERTILQRASVVGRTFWGSAVERISDSANGGMSEQEIRSVLSALQGKEMVFRRETSAFARAQEYIFKHAILREVTYESVLKRVRRVYHTLVAEWLIEHSGERAGEYTGLIAEHLELAGQTERAVIYLGRAAEQAAAQFANVEAVNYFSRALDLTPEDNLTACYTLLLAREQVYNLQGEREAQKQDLAALQELAEALADDRRRAEVGLRQANYAEVTGDFPAAIAASRAAIDLTQATQDASSEAAGYLQWGRALWRQGDCEAAQTQLEQALARARAAQTSASSVESPRRIEADSLRNLGIACWYLGDYAGTRTYFEQALRIFREIGDRQGESATLNNLGVVSADQDDYVEARAYFEQALCIYREIGDRKGEGSLLNNLGNVSADRQGDYAKARAYYEQALRICREVGDRKVENNALTNLGNVSGKQGDYAGAKAYFEQSLLIYREIGDGQGEGEVLAYLGLLSHHLGDDEAAREYSQQALRIAQDLNNRRVQGYASTNLGHALAGLGHLGKAADAYRQALALRHELGQPNLVMETLAGLARVSVAQGDLAEAQAQVEEILGHLETNTLDGTEEPFQVYLTCYRILSAHQDPRAQAILNTAHSLLQERAAKISDEEMRRSFLEKVAAHRGILSEWANSE